MIVTCPDCATRYAVDDTAFRAGGRAVRCAHCGCEWYQIGPAELANGGLDGEALPLTELESGGAVGRRAPLERAPSPDLGGRGLDHVRAARRSLSGDPEEPARAAPPPPPPPPTREPTLAEATARAEDAARSLSTAGLSSGRAPLGESPRALAPQPAFDSTSSLETPPSWDELDVPVNGHVNGEDHGQDYDLDHDAYDDEPDFYDIETAKDRYAAPPEPDVDDGLRAGVGPATAPAFGRTDGMLRRPTPSGQGRNAAVGPLDAAPVGAVLRPRRALDADHEELDENGYRRMRAVGAPSGKDDSLGRGDIPPQRERRGRSRRRFAPAAMGAGLVAAGLAAAYALGPQLAEFAPQTAPAVDAYRDRVNAVFASAPALVTGEAGLVFEEFQYNLVERAEGPALEVWGKVRNAGPEDALTPTIEIVSRNENGEALQRWLAHPEAEQLGVGESARFTSRMMYPLGPVYDVDLYIAAP